jgi:hypothetical protein
MIRLFQVFTVLLVVTVLSGCLPPVENDDTSLTENDSLADSGPEILYIPGVMPVDVYLNLEDEGFTTERKFRDSESGHSWTSQYAVPGLEYEVVTFSRDINRVESVSAYIMIDPAQKRPEAAQMFLLYLATLPYEGADPEAAQEWIRENFNTHQAETVIGGVSFRMLAASDMVRGIVIEPERS